MLRIETQVKYTSYPISFRTKRSKRARENPWSNGVSENSGGMSQPLFIETGGEALAREAEMGKVQTTTSNLSIYPSILYYIHIY
jgi:hypothetical protein